MIAVIDYGLGNITAISNVYRRSNVPVRIARRPGDLQSADKFILPGVGAFDQAMSRFEATGMRDALQELVVGDGRALLGICVGMQLLADRSDEGKLAGLGWIPGEVKRFDADQAERKPFLPHMGWNDVLPAVRNGLFHQLETGARFYFLHSYHFVPDDDNGVLSTTEYLGRFVSSVCAGNILGVQFHPEKSHGWGIQLLKNFAEL